MLTPTGLCPEVVQSEFNTNPGMILHSETIMFNVKQINSQIYGIRTLYIR